MSLLKFITLFSNKMTGESRRLTSGHYRSSDRNQSKSHGMCLTPSDLDRLRIFMHEFVVRALIPWAERQMKILNEQVCGIY